MSKQDISTPEGAENPTAEKTVEEQSAVAPKAEPAKSVGEMINETEPKAPAKDAEAPTVGLDKYLKVKKEKKALEAKIEQLAKSNVNDDLTDAELSGSLSDLADEYGVDKGFLAKLTKRVEANYAETLEQKINEKLEPLTAKQKQERLNKVFDTAFGEAIEGMPEYKDIANPEVIKSLATNPANANKTMPQIIEETYSKAVTGKPTIDSTKPAGGKEPTEVDIARAQSDPEYFSKIMANPALKAKYNEKALGDVLKHL